MKITYEEGDEIERFYLPTFRIEILESLEKELNAKKYTRQFISEAMGCLRFYTTKLDNVEELRECEGDGSNILKIIADKMDKR